ncbi:TPA: hypothetical protein N0F65_002515, partial [Lagenidium giganteum]
ATTACAQDISEGSRRRRGCEARWCVHGVGFEGTSGARASPRTLAGTKYVEPENYAEAQRSYHSQQWAEAEAIELRSLKKNRTWEVVVLLAPDDVTLHTKWVYKLKKRGDGVINKWKARLVGCGNEQVAGRNYEMTFSDVVEMLKVRVIIVLGKRWGTPGRHGDVPSAFVKACTEPGLRIVLDKPQGMTISREMMELRKSLYGLKQAGRLWRSLVHKTLIGKGYQQTYTDSCVYVKRDARGVTVVGVYVDDTLVTGTSPARVSEFYEDMASIELKNQGPVSKFLGIRVRDTSDGYDLDQQAAIEELLGIFDMSLANLVKVPSDEDLLPVASDATCPSRQDFPSLMGSLLWLARCTRPDISFAVHRASRRTHAPTHGDWRMAKRILHYLIGTRDFSLLLRCSQNHTNASVRVSAYSDANYAGDAVDRKSVSGGLVLLNDAPISWMCKKQTAVALSTAEAEFAAAVGTLTELIGVQALLQEIGVTVESPSVLFMDNQAAQLQLESETTSGRVKHVDVKLKFARDIVKKRTVTLKHGPTAKMIADVFTKGAPAPRMAELRVMIGLHALEDAA